MSPGCASPVTAMRSPSIDIALMAWWTRVQRQARRALVADPGLRPRPEAAAAHGVVETIHCRNRLVALEREMTLAVVDGSGARRGPRPPGRRRPGRGERSM